MKSYIIGNTVQCGGLFLTLHAVLSKYLTHSPNNLAKENGPRSISLLYNQVNTIRDVVL